mmetsp:Transcript_16343/g.45014  ORF Transcript_16343/g.45014 Transcript_16343/m.45014 type:complete len:147 (-) Transcript_16343:98-538(-)
MWQPWSQGLLPAAMQSAAMASRRLAQNAACRWAAAQPTSTACKATATVPPQALGGHLPGLAPPTQKLPALPCSLWLQDRSVVPVMLGSTLAIPLQLAMGWHAPAVAPGGGTVTPLQAVNSAKQLRRWKYRRKRDGGKDRKFRLKYG